MRSRPKFYVPLLVILAACVMAPAAQEAAVAETETSGFSEARLARLEGWIQRAVDEQEIAGAVILLWRDGQVVLHEAYGHADVAAGREMRKDDLFRIASMTKPITSVAVLMLFEEGRFLLDDPIAMYLPEFDRDMQVIVHRDDGYELVPAERPITIRHLLTHTSGISYRFLDVQPLTDLYEKAGISDGISTSAETLQQFSARLAQMPLAHQPGEGWTYGLNTDLLGRLVEVVSGRPFDEFLRTRVFEPLDMRDTYFIVPGAKRDRVAAVYQRNDAGELVRVADGTIEDGVTVFSVDYPFAGESRYRSGGAGLVTTARDYARFLQMIQNGGALDGERLLGRKTVELMLSDQIGRLGQAGFGGAGFGFGFGLDGGPARSGTLSTAGAGGWSGFFTTSGWVDPAEELIAILLTQHYPYDDRLLEQFRIQVYQAVTD